MRGPRIPAGRSARLLVLLAAPLLAACGGREAGTGARPGGWRAMRLEGLAHASGLAVAGDDLLFVASGDDRRLRVLERRRLRDGASVRVEVVPLVVDEGALLTGSEAFAHEGYRLGDLWALPVDFEGVEFRPPDVVFLAERSHRVIYVGRLERGAAGRPRRLAVDRLFAVPGGDRTGSATSDWRDRGPGLAGLAFAPAEGRSQDLFVVDRGGEEPGTFRVGEVDAFGGGRTWFLGVLDGVGKAAVGGLAWDGPRMLLVRGPGRGLLVPIEEGNWTKRVTAGRPVPGPPLPAADRPRAGPWRGLDVSGDGTIHLVSSGEAPWLAWRKE